MKNNKIIKIGGMALLLSLFLFSCSDVLDQAPDGKISLADVFNDDEKTAAYLNSCYLYIPAEGHTYFFWMRGPVDWSDEAWDTDAEAESWITSGLLYNGNVSAASHFNTSWAENGNGNYWVRMWTGIRKCTVFLDNIETAKVKDENNRSRWKAEAHLLRAYYYMFLLKFFGCPLPIERTAYSYTDDFSTTERSSYYDVVKFIIEDCDAALASPISLGESPLMPKDTGLQKLLLKQSNRECHSMRPARFTTMARTIGKKLTRSAKTHWRI